MKEEKPSPEIIYKYSKVNENLFDLLISHQLYFSKPDEFNDPFDCILFTEKPYNEEDIRFYFGKFDAKIFNQEVIEDYVRVWKKAPLKLTKIISETVKKFIHSKGVCCFSSKNNEVLMWSHYADSNRGVCIGFDSKIIEKSFPQNTWVEYDNLYPVINVLRDSNKAINTLLAFKSAKWQYESEIRIIMDRNRYSGFEKAALKEIIFGLRTPHRQMVNIMYVIICLGYYNVKFKQVFLENEKYELKFKDLNFKNEMDIEIEKNKAGSESFNMDFSHLFDEQIN